MWGGCKGIMTETSIKQFFTLVRIFNMDDFECQEFFINILSDIKRHNHIIFNIRIKLVY